MSEVTIEVDGIELEDIQPISGTLDIELEGFEAANIHRNLDSLADGFTFTGPYDPDAPYEYLVRPNQKEAVLYIDGEVYIRGVTEKWDPGFDLNSTVTSVECRTKPGVLLECTSTAKDTTYKNQTLREIAERECEPFGIFPEFPNGDSPKIALAQRCPIDTIFPFLKKLACNYEFLINSTSDGDIAFIKPGLNVENVGSLSQGSEPLITVDTSYDFSKRYSEYTATGQFPGNPKAIATVSDNSVSVYRPIMFRSDAKDATSLLNAAKWRQTRALVAVEVTAKVDGWRDMNGDLWRENRKINLKAPNVYLFNDYEYLIKNVVLDKNESGGETATLTLVMPESFTGEFPISLPWER